MTRAATESPSPSPSPGPGSPAPGPRALESSLEALSTHWEQIGVDVHALGEKPDGTLMSTRAVDEASPAALPSAVLESAQRALTEGGGVLSMDEAIELTAVLGKGGFGVVRAGTQRSLRREVAVKHLKPKVEKKKAGALLLKEAWVGGALSHPNVVPVHTLLEHEGSPAIVMRRVDGVTWSEVIRDPVIRDPRAGRERKIEDPIDWHLRVMIQVANAVAFAHERGVLHLDLKPDNVMIGSFGEVYVVDWGLAAGFGEARPAWLPPASGIQRILGTPSYLAPEQAIGDGERMGPWTDVFQLGATLHHALTGRPPRARGPIPEMLTAAYVSVPPRYEGTEVPEELAEILLRALSRHPIDRYQSAGELREALEAFLLHRQALALIRSAEAKLEALEAQIEDEEVSEAEVQATFTEARFALEQARRSWPESPHVAPLLQSLLSLMVERLLAQGQLDAAEGYLAILPEPRPDLSEALEGARREAEREAERVRALHALHGELDLGVSRAWRVRAILAIGSAWMLGTLGCALADHLGWATIGYPALAGIGAAGLLLFLPPLMVFRRALFRNRINLRIWVLMVATYGLSEADLLGGWARGEAVKSALVSLPFYLTLFFVALGASGARRAYWAVPSMLAAALLALFFQDAIFFLLAFGCLPSLAALIWAERRGALEDAREEEDRAPAP